MRNKYPGKCYRCGDHVVAGDGHFERFNGGWRTQHAGCAIAFRGTSPASGIETRSAIDPKGRGPEGESPTPKADAQKGGDHAS